MKVSPKSHVVSETDVIIYFDGELNRELIGFIQAAKNALLQLFPHDLLDAVPSYQSLLLSFRPQCQIAPSKRLQKALAIIEQLEYLPNTQTQHKTIELPVYYGQEAGADFDAICQQLAIGGDELIALHSQQNYDVFALGFSPGFAFMGELDKALQLPRRTEPRKTVPKGSVAIANKQTAVYPIASPGGWHLIGRCPLELFNPQQPASLLAVGDSVRFVPINCEQFLALGGVF